MDVREKLLDLLLKENYLCKPSECKYCLLNSSCNYYRAAARLIANGVTVQEWISVDDELPEDDSDVLAYLRIGEESRICPANYAKGMWFDWIFNTPVTESITHWMPIPQPPKGE